MEKVGELRDRLRLSRAILRNCTCKSNGDVNCGAHKLESELGKNDSMVYKRLIWYRRIKGLLELEEWDNGNARN